MCKDYDLKKDIALKDYFRYNVNFADFFNGTIFCHKKVLDSKFLREADSDVSGFNEKELKTYERRRDVVKRYETDDCCFYLGIENQSKVDKTMPLRTIVYDTFQYNNQLKNKEAHPMLSIIFYHGDDKWDIPIHLKDMLEYPQEIKDLFNDYHSIIIDLKELNEEEFQVKSNQLLIKYGKMIFENWKDPKIFEEVILPKDTALVLAAIVNSKELFLSIEESNKEDIEMCRQLELLKEDGRIEGEIIGERNALVKSMKKIMSRFNYTIDEAMDFLEVPQTQREEIQALLVN